MLVHCRQGVDPPPALIPVGPLLKAVPGIPGGVLALVGSRLRVEAVPVEVAADKAGVVEHPVQHHPHSQAVGLPAELGKVLLTAQHGVDPAVIRCAIAVVLCRLKDGAEVEGRHPQAVEIVQLLHHAPQVPAEKIPVADLAVPVRAVLRLLLPGGVDPAPAHQPIGLGDPGTAEAVGEDLIGHPLSEPGGDLLSAIVHSQLIGTQLLALLPVQPLQREGVPHQPHIVPSVQHAGEQVPVPIQSGPGHGNGAYLVLPGLEPRGEQSAGIALLPQRPEGQKHRGPRRRRPIGGLAPGIPGVVDRFCHGSTFCLSQE